MAGQTEFGKIIKSFINLAFNEASGLITRHVERVLLLVSAASSYRQRSKLDYQNRRLNKQVR